MVSPVNQSDNDEMLTCQLGASRKAVDPCSVVIFGASGDLTARKLIPALYHLFKERQMPPDFRIVGFARREKTDESWEEPAVRGPHVPQHSHCGHFAVAAACLPALPAKPILKNSVP